MAEPRRLWRQSRQLTPTDSAAVLIGYKFMWRRAVQQAVTPAKQPSPARIGSWENDIDAVLPAADTRRLRDQDTLAYL
jgi:hypothetical protein